MPTTTDPQTRRQQAAAILGVQETTLGTVKFQLNRLRQLGLLVDIDVRGISMFSAAASFAEWGIGDDDVRHSRLRGGVKYLIPEVFIKAIRSIESGIRQNLDTYSYDEVTAFLPWRWIPFTAYQEWRDRHDKKVVELEAIKKDILKQYDSLLDQLAADFANVARSAWRSITAQGYDAVAVDGQEFDSEDAYVDYVVGQAVAKFPTKARIKADLKIDYRTALLEDDADVQERMLAEDRSQAARESIRVEAQAEARRQYLYDQEAQAKLDAMRAAEMEHARKRIAEMGSPIDDLVNALRARIKTDVLSMLESVKKNGFLRGKVAEKGAGLLEFYDLMSVADDRAMRSKLAELKTLIGPIGDGRGKDTPDRDVIDITEALKSIADLASAEASNMALVNRFTALEV